ncbi:hypothetical protein BHM03_00006088 [Ensete ventricosum]|nr:hypothetical protein BHM03_00006088 [Ensete ventricosum]
MRPTTIYYRKRPVLGNGRFFFLFVTTWTWPRPSMCVVIKRDVPTVMMMARRWYTVRGGWAHMGSVRSLAISFPPSASVHDRLPVPWLDDMWGPACFRSEGP